jgi:hypothetical protein
MEDGDDSLKLAILVVCGLAALAWLLGGFLTRAQGTYRDGDKEVVLQQLGPWVWGASTFAGGKQLYRGSIFFGRIRLQRRDEGRDHLLALGFTAEQAPWLAGQVTAHLTLRQGDNRLQGRFVGRKFSFDEEGIREVTHVPAAQRTWERVGAAA